MKKKKDNDKIKKVGPNVERLWYNHNNDQRTNGPVNAHLISWPSKSWPSKAQNIQNLENIW